jgi:hypothetical protein
VSFFVPLLELLGSTGKGYKGLGHSVGGISDFDFVKFSSGIRFFIIRNERSWTPLFFFIRFAAFAAFSLSLFFVQLGTSMSPVVRFL